jgi:hypothetical protein
VKTSQRGDKKRRVDCLIAEKGMKPFVERRKENVSKKEIPKNGLALWTFAAGSCIVLPAPLLLNEWKQNA